MPVNGPIVGQVVLVTAGRDKGSVFMVIGTGTWPNVFLADGRTRTVEKPKKKNIRHVQALQAAIPTEIAAKLFSGVKLSNEDVRQAIAAVGKPDSLDKWTRREISCPSKM